LAYYQPLPGPSQRYKYRPLSASPLSWAILSPRAQAEAPRLGFSMIDQCSLYL